MAQTKWKIVDFTEDDGVRVYKGVCMRCGHKWAPKNQVGWNVDDDSVMLECPANENGWHGNQLIHPYNRETKLESPYVTYFMYVLDDWANRTRPYISDRRFPENRPVELVEMAWWLYWLGSRSSWLLMFCLLRS